MRFANKQVLFGVLTGILLSVGGIGIYAHAGHGEGHGMHGVHADNQLSITGSPAELAQRARDLGQHICETIKVAFDCPVTPAADSAFAALSAMQATYQQGQQQMHGLLTSTNFDSSAFASIQSQQAQAVQAGTTRYLQFLADAATALTPEQRQMFSRNGHDGS